MFSNPYPPISTSIQTHRTLHFTIQNPQRCSIPSSLLSCSPWPHPHWLHQLLSQSLNTTRQLLLQPMIPSQLFPPGIQATNLSPPTLMIRLLQHPHMSTHGPPKPLFTTRTSFLRARAWVMAGKRAIEDMILVSFALETQIKLVGSGGRSGEAGMAEILLVSIPPSRPAHVFCI
jgi:hypothetical protein